MTLLSGTLASDHLTGKATGDTIRGSGGDDWLEGVGGADKLAGEAGDDDLEGGVGNDTLLGGSGYDYLVGGDGNDIIDGGRAADTGAPSWWGEFDTVSYRGEGGTQGVSVNLATGRATDSFGKTDTLTNVERVLGTLYQDTLIGGNPASDEHESFTGYAGADIIKGGSGFDTVDYFFDKEDGGDAGIAANLAAGTIRDGFGDTDRVSGIEEVRGTYHSDVFTGSGRDERFMPSGGNDMVDGGSGSDTVAYNIEVWRDGKTGIIADLNGRFVSDCNGSFDRLVSIENVRGSFWDDLITGDGFDNELRGYEGADSVRGRDGADSVYGGAGNDTLYGGSGRDYIEGWTGTDWLRGGADTDYFGIYAESETDILLDFRSGTDKLDVSSFHFASTSAVLKLLKVVSDSVAVLELRNDIVVEFHNVNTHATVLAAGDLII